MQMEDHGQENKKQNAKKLVIRSQIHSVEDEVD